MFKSLPVAIVRLLLIVPLISACQAEPKASPAQGEGLVDGAQEDRSWPVYRGDQKGSGRSSLTQINRDTVSGLDLAWEYKTGDVQRFPEDIKDSALEVTPILVPPSAGSSLVMCTPFNAIVAIDPETGEERWRHQGERDENNPRPSKCRGVSWWQDKSAPKNAHCEHRIFHATHNRRLQSVDAKSGKLCDEFGEQGVVKLYTEEEGYVPGDIASSSAPIIAGGNIIVGSAVVDFKRAKTPQGTVQAYDARTGKRVWIYHMIPSAKTQDQELKDSWPENARDVSGSANAWAPMSVDEQRGWVFVPTGSPSADFFGGLRPGNNLNANSLLVLDIATGKLIWRYQFVHHDLWDYDTPAQPLLTEISVKGEALPVVIQVTKQGFVFVLHRDTGEPVFAVEEVPVSQTAVAGEWLSPTQPRPTFPEPLMEPALAPENAWGFTPFDRNACKKKLEGLFNEGLFTPLQLDRWTTLMPGSLGGANWGGSVYWPKNNTLYVNINTAPFRARLVKTVEEVEASHLPEQGKTMRISMKGTGYTIENETLVSPLGAPCIEPPWGKMVALDLTTGKPRWSEPLGSIHQMSPIPLPFQMNWGTPNLGGALVTDGGLVFIGATMDRLFRAFDAHTGEVVWDYTLPSDGVASPMTYAVNGKQYVVIAAGGHHMYGRKMGDSIMAFRLKNK